MAAVAAHDPGTDDYQGRLPVRDVLAVLQPTGQQTVDRLGERDARDADHDRGLPRVVDVEAEHRQLLVGSRQAVGVTGEPCDPGDAGVEVAMLTVSVLGEVLPGPLDLEHDAHVPTGRHHVRDPPVPWDLGLGGPTGSSDGLDDDRLRAQVLCALAGAAAVAAGGVCEVLGAELAGLGQPLPPAAHRGRTALRPDVVLELRPLLLGEQATHHRFPVDET